MIRMKSVGLIEKYHIISCTSGKVLVYRINKLICLLTLVYLNTKFNQDLIFHRCFMQVNEWTGITVPLWIHFVDRTHKN